MTQQLAAVVPSGALAPSVDPSLIPALIADAGEQAGWRYVEFFTANIRNPNTRCAYARVLDLLRKSGELLMRQEEFSGHEAEAVHEGI